MIRKKPIRLAGRSLTIGCVLLFVWAMTSMLYARADWSALNKSGGDTLGTCKQPCDDTTLISIIECDHVGDPNNPCETDRCTINNLRLLSCVECEDAEEGAGDCEYHTDPNDWVRWVTVREMPCDSTTPSTEDLGECTLGSAHTGTTTSEFTTPCVVGECYGELYYDASEATGRPLCGAS